MFGTGISREAGLPHFTWNECFHRSPDITCPLAAMSGEGNNQNEGICIWKPVYLGFL